MTNCDYDTPEDPFIRAVLEQNIRRRPSSPLGGYEGNDEKEVKRWQRKKDWICFVINAPRPQGGQVVL